MAWVNRFAFPFLLFLERDRICDPRVVRACVSSRALARECHIAQTRKPLKTAREMALFGARVPARRGVARIVSRTYTLARAPYRFVFIATLFDRPSPGRTVVLG